MRQDYTYDVSDITLIRRLEIKVLDPTIVAPLCSAGLLTPLRNGTQTRPSMFIDDIDKTRCPKTARPLLTLPPALLLL